jgi:nitrate reductase NapE component
MLTTDLCWVNTLQIRETSTLSVKSRSEIMTKNSSEKISFLSRATVISAILAAVGWGGWGFFVNLEAGGFRQAALSGTLQGFNSGIMVLILASYLLLVSRKTLSWKFGIVWPVFSAVFLIACIAVTAHWMIGTPHIFKTVAGPITVALIFSTLTTRRFRKQLMDSSKSQVQESPPTLKAG